mmetsp:Transcript_123999/g.277143  ORF Transcript_123999/g.277143 Transcript_123999/m.277143 type:complete len:203 (+) Transcript_123999:450-1058(+)
MAPLLTCLLRPHQRMQRRRPLLRRLQPLTALRLRRQWTARGAQRQEDGRCQRRLKRLLLLFLLRLRFLHFRYLRFRYIRYLLTLRAGQRLAPRPSLHRPCGATRATTGPADLQELRLLVWQLHSPLCQKLPDQLVRQGRHHIGRAHSDRLKGELARRARGLANEHCAGAARRTRLRPCGNWNWMPVPTCTGGSKGMQGPQYA